MSDFKLTGSDVFGMYCRIEQFLYCKPNEMHLYKVVASLRTNSWCEVPYKAASKEVWHDRMEDCILAIHCGIDETKVQKFRIADVEFLPRKECDREALMKLADDIECEQFDNISAPYCEPCLLKSNSEAPICGVCIARRIREACNGGERTATDATDSDGVECHEGDTVWLALRYRPMAGKSPISGRVECGLAGVGKYDALKIKKLFESEGEVVARFDNDFSPWCPVSWLTHTNPDTWAELKEDMKIGANPTMDERIEWFERARELARGIS